MSQDESYGWNDGGSDGLRSFSYTGSNISWPYVFPSGSVSRKGALNFFVGAVFPTSSITINNVSIVGDSAATLIYTPGEYMRHGNLYNWTAATLGSGMLMENGNQKALDSICPKGWKLPSIDNEASDSFANLLRVGEYYNIPSSTIG